jgi:hypothetical protein
MTATLCLTLHGGIKLIIHCISFHDIINTAFRAISTIINRQVNVDKQIRHQLQYSTIILQHTPRLSLIMNELLYHNTTTYSMLSII